MFTTKKIVQHRSFRNFFSSKEGLSIRPTNEPPHTFRTPTQNKESVLASSEFWYFGGLHTCGGGGHVCSIVQFIGGNTNR